MNNDSQTHPERSLSISHYSSLIFDWFASMHGVYCCIMPPEMGTVRYPTPHPLPKLVVEEPTKGWNYISELLSIVQWHPKADGQRVLGEGINNTLNLSNSGGNCLVLMVLLWIGGLLLLAQKSNPNSSPSASNLSLHLIDCYVNAFNHPFA